ncbi:MAG: TetR/AcrR family transcriptional regulator [Spirochaetes bacterium]|nr:TetR/AcrR family transcriptional regulator [Spirochaetota bacterium]
MLTARQRSITDAALAVIAENGIETLTVKAIGKRLRISDAALYKHFPGKNDILAAIVDLFRDGSLDALKKINDNGICSSLERIGRFLIDRAEYFSANPSFVTVMFPETMLRGNKKLFRTVLEGMDAHKQAVVGIIRQGQSAREIVMEDPDDMFMIIMGAFRLLLTRWMYSGNDFDLVKKTRALFETIKPLLTANKK